MAKAKEAIKWNAKWRVEKYRGNLPTEEDRKLFKPYEVVEGEGNLLLNEGINELFTLLCGTGGTKYDNSNARLGVGSSNATAIATQTGLSSVITIKAMDATYPISGADQKAVFRATFASADGNGAWEEWSLDNGAARDKNLNRKVTSLGTKVSGTSWVFTVEVSLS